MNYPPTNCSNCGAALEPGMRFCQECGTPVASALQAAQPTWGAPVATGFESGLTSSDYWGSDPLLEYAVEYPERLSRWKIFVKWLLAIPHYIILSLLAFVMFFVWIVSFFAILITGKFPRGLWDFQLLYMRWNANVTAYAYLLQRDEYPPFGDSGYPVHIKLDYPSSLSRWKIFVKWLLAIPHYIILGLLFVAEAIVVFVAFFAILITGKYPRGMFEFVVGVNRWSTRVSAYTNFMTDRYPPFSLD